jgi:uncharacterized protein (TIGR04255 family)
MASDRLGTGASTFIALLTIDSVATLRQLANPPLREALVDIQHSTELSAHFLGEIEGLSIPGLHKKGPITAEKFEIKIGQPAEALKRQADIIGWSFASEDGSRLAQGSPKWDYV